jgi:hypothetical protein
MLTVDLILHDRLAAEEEQRRKDEQAARDRAEGAASNFLTLLTPDNIVAQTQQTRDEIGLLALQRGFNDIQAAGINISPDTYREYLYEYGDPGHLRGTLQAAQQQGILNDPAFAQRTADRFSALTDIATQVRTTAQPLPKEDYWNLIAAAEQPKVLQPAPSPAVPRPMTVAEEQAAQAGRAATVNPSPVIQPSSMTPDVTVQQTPEEKQAAAQAEATAVWGGRPPPYRTAEEHPVGQGPEAALRPTFEVLPPGASPQVLKEHKAVTPAMVELPPGFKPAEIIVRATIFGGIAPTLGLWMAGLSAATSVPKVGGLVTKVLELPAKPMESNLIDMGVPKSIARPLADIVTGAAIGKAPVGQTNWLGEALTALRGGDTAQLARAVTAIRKGILTPEVEAQAFSEGRTKDWLGLGARVRAADRNNLGTVVSYDEASNTARVRFYNQKTGLRATVDLDAKLLSPAGKPASGAAAREETAAMEQAVAEARAEQAGPLVYKMFRTLDSAQFLTAQQQREALIATHRRGAAGAIETIAGKATLETIESSMAQAGGVLRGKTAANLGLTEPWSTAEIAEFRTNVFKSPLLKPMEKYRGGMAVKKLLEAKQILMPSEAKLLGKVYPELRSVLMNITKPENIPLWRQIVDLANINRAFEASYDLSWALRQGGLLIGRKELWGAFKEAGAAVPKWGTDWTNKQMLDWAASPYWERATKAGLSIGDPGTGIVEEAGIELPGAGRRIEEAYVAREKGSWANQIASKIPGVPQSQRAYTMMGNKTRWDYFTGKLAEWDANGLATPQAERALAQWINIASGWGDIGVLEKVLPELSAVLFAPRFLASRIEALPYGIYLAVKNPVLARSIAYDLLSFTASQASLLAVMKYGIDGKGVPGVSVELDPRSTDFGRIQVGHTRLDTLAGMQPIIRNIAQIIVGQGKSSATGELYPMNRVRTGLRWGQSKLAPGLGFLTDIGLGETYIGEPLEPNKATIKATAWNRLAPFLAQDITDAVKLNTPGVAAITAALGLFGGTVLTYETPWQNLQDARGEASKVILKMSYTDACDKWGTRAVNDMLAGDPGVVAADQAVENRKAWYGNTNTSLRSLLAGYAKEQLEVGDKIADPVKWKADHTTRQTEKAGAIAGFYFANREQRDRMLKERTAIGDPFQIPKNATPDDIVARYLAIYTDHTNLETGTRDDTLYDDLDRLQAILTPQQASWLDANLGLRATPREKKYYAVLKEAQGYYDIQEATYLKFQKQLGLTSESYSVYLNEVTQEAQAKAKAAGREAGFVAPEDYPPQYAVLKGLIDDEQTLWREKNPKIVADMVRVGLKPASQEDIDRARQASTATPIPPLTLPTIRW